MSKRAFLWVATLFFDRTVLSSELSLVTWNTMQYGDAYSTEWGTPTEIERANRLAKERGISLETARDILADSRFQREADRLREWQKNYDVIALQEVEFTHENAVRLIDKIELVTSEWIAGCPLPAPESTSTFATPLLLRRQRFTNVVPLSNGTKDIPGCIVEAVTREGLTMVIGSLHAKSGPIRADAVSTVRSFLQHLDDNLNNRTDQLIFLGGDWNSHMYDLLPLFQSSSPDWTLHTVPTNDTPLWSLPRFTSQHEHNWLAAYDGWFVLTPASIPRYRFSSTELREGFLPKYLLREGDSTYRASPFYYGNCRGEDGPASRFPECISGQLKIETNGATWIYPHLLADVGLSDHMAVEMRIHDEHWEMSLT
ncbi:hypothetical protein FOL47_010635 [Perkinsus chesapeaki]|uniref:Endonuclease/exonuclease/phosphatase domain-containing protein n=1 Tax=Perkinsus chesapeaki TaxID=330153 RepID=A0A7J6MP62_PERCH|nr:hypothetical protein FOL47_010635 [Perkinsus chesapeaki]